MVAKRIPEDALNRIDVIDSMHRGGRDAGRHAKRSQVNVETMSRSLATGSGPILCAGAATGTVLTPDLFVADSTGGGLAMTACEACGGSFPRRPGRGRPARFCSASCRDGFAGVRAPYVHRDPLTCAVCGSRMAQDRTSAPQGQARCRPCRQRGNNVL
jgi:hypothetical protein